MTKKRKEENGYMGILGILGLLVGGLRFDVCAWFFRFILCTWGDFYWDCIRVASINFSTKFIFGGELMLVAVVIIIII